MELKDYNSQEFSEKKGKVKISIPGKIMIGFACIMVVLIIIAIISDTKSSENSSEINNTSIFNIGDNIEFESGISVTVLETGMTMDDQGTVLVYANVDITNSSSSNIQISFEDFKFYGDGYALTSVYPVNDYIVETEIGAGRKLNRTLYAECNNYVYTNKIELQIGAAIVMVKDAESLMKNGEIDYKEAYYNIVDSYRGQNDLCNYCVYDLDNDGIRELYVSYKEEFGSNDVYANEVYTIQDSSAVLIGYFESSDGPWLYSTPDRYGIYVDMSGYYETGDVYLLTKDGDQIKLQKTDNYSYDEDEDYIEAYPADNMLMFNQVQ